MSGTREGGIKAAQTNKERYGKDHYEKIGRIGGSISRGGGFAMNPELAIEAGRKGGKTSRFSKGNSFPCPGRQAHPMCAKMFKTAASAANHAWRTHR